jgi:hypothetical protein
MRITYRHGVGTNTTKSHSKQTWKSGGLSDSWSVDANWRWTQVKDGMKKLDDADLWSDTMMCQSNYSTM